MVNEDIGADVVKSVSENGDAFNTAFTNKMLELQFTVVGVEWGSAAVKKLGEKKEVRACPNCCEKVNYGGVG